MRLIDADPIYDALFGIKAYEGIGPETVVALTDINALIETAPRVDAIPIEWLRAKQHELKDYIDHRPDAVVDYLIWLWDREAR